MKAVFVGAKRVPPTDDLEVVLRVSRSPVLVRPSSRVEKVVGRWVMMASAGGGGSRMAEVA